MLKWLSTRVSLWLMLPTIKRTDPEQIFAIWKNTDTVDLVDGDVVQLDTAAAAADLGNAVVGSPAGAAALACMGIVGGSTIAVGQYGKVLVYGVHNNAKGLAAINAAKVGVQNSATAKTLTIGTLGTDEGAWLGFSLAATATGRVKVFLRCM